MDALDQREISNLAALRARESGHVSLMMVRHSKQNLGALVVAHTAEQAIAAIQTNLGNATWTRENTEVRAVQRNVEMQPGIFGWVPWRSKGGDHHNLTEAGLAARRRKKLRQRSRDK